MNIVSRISCVALVLELIASPAAAQLWDNPVQVSPEGATGLTIAGDVGHGMNGATDRGTSYNTTVTVGWPFLQVTVGMGVNRFRAEPLNIVNANQASPGSAPTGVQQPAATTVNSINFMGQAALTLVPSTPTWPLDVVLFGGVGLAAGVEVTTVPAGLAFGVELPSRGVSIEPWVAPRFTYVPGSRWPSETFYGVSGGLNVDPSARLGLQAAVDYLGVGYGSPVLMSVGVRYRFSVPAVGADGR